MDLVSALFKCKISRRLSNLKYVLNSINYSLGESKSASPFTDGHQEFALHILFRRVHGKIEGIKTCKKYETE